MKELSAAIKTKIEKLAEKYGDGFDKVSFIKAAEEHYKKYGSLSGFSSDSFKNNAAKSPQKKENKKTDDAENTYSSPEKSNSYNLNFNNNSAKDKYGNNFNASNPYELFNQINDEIVKSCNEKGISPIHCKLTLNSVEKTREDIKEACALSAVEHDIIMSGDYPQNPAFWSQLKTDYLNDSKHSLADWNKLTAFIPKELTEQQKPDEKLKSLSQGDTPKSASPAKKTQVPPKLNIQELSNLKQAERQ